MTHAPPQDPAAPPPAPVPAPPPASADLRRRRPEVRPHEILAAAIEAFASQGLAVARLEDIARRAGLSKGTIYLYYADKDALFRACVRATIDGRLDAAERALAATLPTGDDVVGALRAYLIGWWRLLETDDYQLVFRLLQTDQRVFGDLVAHHETTIVRRARDLVAALLERGMGVGAFRRADSAAATRHIVALLYAHGARRTGGRVPGDAPHVQGDGACDAAFEQCFDFILHGLAAPRR